jgi:two-component system, chemotaxis family, chemotaxis protein CheY
MALDLSMPILVVDDNPSVLGVLVLLLEQIGFTSVDDAADGTTALAKVQQKNYGLVISDWQMQPMDGYALLKEIRSIEALAKTPFIMVTVSPEAGKVVSAKHAGANGYIVKPFSAKILKTKIKQAVSGRGRYNRRPMSAVDLAVPEEVPDDSGEVPLGNLLRGRKRARRSLLARLRLVQLALQRDDD